MADREYLGGVTNTTLHFETDGTMHIEEKQDCELIFDYAKACRNNRFSADCMDGMLQHVAEVPVVIYLHECRKRGVRPFSREGDLVLEAIIADPAYSEIVAAPKLRDPHIIMKGVR